MWIIINNSLYNLDYTLRITKIKNDTGYVMLFSDGDHIRITAEQLNDVINKLNINSENNI